MNEIQFSKNDYPGTSLLYATVSLASNGMYANAAALELYKAFDWAMYAIPLTLDPATGLYQGNFPSVPNGLYSVAIWQQIGASPATTDTQLAQNQYQQAGAESSYNNAIQLAAADYPGSNPLYFVVCFPETDQYVNRGAFETYAAVDWPLYATPMALDVPSGLYQGSFPALPSGDYLVTIYEQLGASPLPADLLISEGEYQQVVAGPQVAEQMQIDAMGFISDFAEPIIYYAYDDSSCLAGTYYINAVVNRNPAAVIQEDGKVLADDVEICIANDLVLGRPCINKGRDKVSVSGRFGGIIKTHLVTTIISGDSGIWSLRVK